LNKPKEAENFYEKSLGLDESNARVHWNLGKLLSKSQKFSPAQYHYERASELDPKYKELLSTLALQEAEVKDMSMYFSDSLKEIPKDPESNDIRNKNHPFHERFQRFLEFRQVGDLSNPAREESETIHPAWDLNIKPNFERMLNILTSRHDFCDVILVEWAKLLYIGFNKEPENMYVLAGESSVNVKHLAGMLVLANQFREILLRNHLPEKVTLNHVLKKEVAKFAMRLYTLESEVGGPYREVNDKIQLDHNGLDKVKPYIEDDKHPGLQPHLIVCYGFFYLFKHHWAEYGINHTNAAEGAWRGMKNISDEQWNSYNGECVEFYWPCFVSTSLEKKVAVNFCRDDPDKEEEEVLPTSVLFHIALSDKTYALSLRKLSMVEKENEVLLHPYHRFRILEKVKDPTFKGRGILNLQCVDCKFHTDEEY